MEVGDPTLSLGRFSLALEVGPKPGKSPGDEVGGTPGRRGNPLKGNPPVHIVYMLKC